MAAATGKTYVNANTGGHHSHIVLIADADNAFTQNTTQVTDPVVDNPHGGKWTPQANPKVSANGRKLFIKMKCAAAPSNNLKEVPDIGNLSITVTGSTVTTQPVVVPVAYSDDPTP